MDTLFGLPSHVLIVHAVVVLGPLAALLGLGIAIRPGWAFYLRWPVLVLSLISAGAAILAASAGEALEERLGGNALIEQHAEDGEMLRLAAIIYLAVAVLAFLSITVRSPLQSSRGGFTSRLPAMLGPVSRGLLAAAAIWLIVQTTITGHSGATAVWRDVVQYTSTPRGEAQ